MPSNTAAQWCGSQVSGVERDVLQEATTSQEMFFTDTAYFAPKLMGNVKVITVAINTRRKEKKAGF